MGKSVFAAVVASEIVVRANHARGALVVVGG